MSGLLKLLRSARPSSGWPLRAGSDPSLSVRIRPRTPLSKAPATSAHLEHGGGSDPLRIAKATPQDLRSPLKNFPIHRINYVGIVSQHHGPSASRTHLPRICTTPPKRSQNAPFGQACLVQDRLEYVRNPPRQHRAGCAVKPPHAGVTLSGLRRRRRVQPHQQAGHLAVQPDPRLVDRADISGHHRLQRRHRRDDLRGIDIDQHQHRNYQ